MFDFGNIVLDCDLVAADSEGGTVVDIHGQLAVVICIRAAGDLLFL